MSSNRKCSSLFNQASLKSNECDSIQRKIGTYFWQASDGNLLPVRNITNAEMRKFKSLEEQYGTCLDMAEVEYKKYSSCMYGKK
jgi:hypothetical protein